MDNELTEPTEVDTSEALIEGSEEPAGESYTVTVDGDETQVSLSELQDGYQRQADYTRKTQELAGERKRLQQAEAIVSSLESDPAGTLNALGEAFGVSPPPPQAPTPQRATDSWDDDWSEEQPVKEDGTSLRVAHLEARLEQQDRLSRRQAVEQQVEGLKDQYGDFSSDDLFQHALRHKIGNLEAALTHMRFGDVSERAAKLEKEAERTGAKRDAGVVESSGSKAAGAVSSKASGDKGPQTVREAFIQAKKNLV
jgi:hypothetical protein